MNVSSIVGGSIHALVITTGLSAGLVAGSVIGLNLAAAVVASDAISIPHSDMPVATLNGSSIAARVQSRFIGKYLLMNSDISLTTGAVVRYRRVTDDWIATRVKSTIFADRIGRSVAVSVTASDGVVVLKGTLASRDAVLHMKHIASRVKGVKGVNTVALVVART